MNAKKNGDLSDLVTTLLIDKSDFLGEIVNSSSGTTFPKELSVSAQLGSGPFLQFSFVVEDERPVLSSVTIERSPQCNAITASVIHRLPMGAIIEEVVAKWATFSALAMRGITAAASNQQPQRLTSTESETVRNGTLSGMRGRPVSENDLRQVAEIVRQNSYNPRAQIRDELGVSLRTASRWIANARRRGFLGDSDNP